MTKHLKEEVQKAIEIARICSKDNNFSLCSVARVLSRKGYDVTGNFIGGILQDEKFLVSDVEFEFEIQGEAFDPFRIFGNWQLKETLTKE